MNWFKLTPHEKVRNGFITWSANHEYQFSRIRLNFIFITRLDRMPTVKAKFYLQIIPFLRWLFDKPLSCKEMTLNASQIDPDLYHKIK